jgi:hypothetical protein
MSNRIIGKVLWLGRGTATIMGLALMVAVVLGVATTAMAALPGDPFRLGEPNAINALTRLAGNVNSAMLRIDNNSTGASATALDLQVEPGKAPMKVDSATKVASLNADRLDGQNAPLLVRVQRDGDLSSNDTIANVTHPSAGRYEFEFVNRAVSGCVFQATPVGNGVEGGEISVDPGSASNQLTVFTTRNGLDFNARYDMAFHLVLYC